MGLFQTPTQQAISIARDNEDTSSQGCRAGEARHQNLDREHTKVYDTAQTHTFQCHLIKSEQAPS